MFKSVSVLSGGEQSRLRLCMLMDDEVNFLILDEPTNHLDIASREWIEEAVEAFDGTPVSYTHLDVYKRQSRGGRGQSGTGGYPPRIR